MELPLFPLSTIVMPAGLLPLRLFEPRYIDMITNCFKTGTGFGVCLIREGHEVGRPSEPYPRGTLVSIVDFDQGSDGLLHITTRGEQEFRILTYAPNDAGLQIGQVSLQEPAPPTPMSADAEALAGKLRLILKYLDASVSYEETHFDDADWVCHRLLELLPIAAPARFELLEMNSNQERLDCLSGLQIEIRD